jgi:hypothetical protein
MGTKLGADRKGAAQGSQQVLKTPVKLVRGQGPKKTNANHTQPKLVSKNNENECIVTVRISSSGSPRRV